MNVSSSVDFAKSEAEEFKNKQIQELEQLQKVLDSNKNLRAKYNALQTQVAPLVDQFGQQPLLQGMQSERVYSAEEIKGMRQKLEQILSEYREETRHAGLISSDIENLYSVLSNLKMKFRIDQDERLSRQNDNSLIAVSNFETKSKRVHDGWNAELQRLEKSIFFLKKVYDESSADLKEFEVQTSSNIKGIMHLSSSITIAKEDIREYSEQLSKLEPKMKEYEIVSEKHKQSEVELVSLSDELENLKKQVDTESLTAKVKRQIDGGQQTISDLNISIDKVQLKTSQIQEKIRETTKSIQNIQSKIETIKTNIAGLKVVRKEMEEEKQKLMSQINISRITQEKVAGGNESLERSIASGISINGAKPWTIRKQLLSLKGEVKEMERILAHESLVEQRLNTVALEKTVAPSRKRVPLIPLH